MKRYSVTENQLRTLAVNCCRQLSIDDIGRLYPECGCPELKEKLQGAGEAITGLLTSEENLRKALEEYGKHRSGCAILEYRLTPRQCDCGFEEAFRGEEDK